MDDRFRFFDGVLWACYPPSHIWICHNRLATNVEGQVGNQLEVQVSAGGVYVDILRILVSDRFHADVSDYVQGQFIIFLGGLAGHPRLFISSLNSDTTAQVARVVELLLEAYKKAMGQRSDGCKAEGGSDSKDKEGGDLLLRNMLPSGSISFKKKHQDLLGLNLFGLTEKVLLRRTICCSEAAAKRFVSLKKESDKDISSLPRMEVKCSEVNQNLRGLDLYGIRDSGLSRRAISPYALAEMICAAQRKGNARQLVHALERLICKLTLEEAVMATATEMITKKKEARYFYQQVSTNIRKKYERMTHSERYRWMSREERRKSREERRKSCVERLEKIWKSYQERKKKLCEEETRKRKWPFGKPEESYGDAGDCCIPESGEELELISGTSSQ